MVLDETYLQMPNEGIDMIRFTDPDGEHRITDVEAVERQRAAGRRQGFKYPSDAAALTDFMMIHWAWKEGE